MKNISMGLMIWTMVLGACVTNDDETALVNTTEQHQTVSGKWTADFNKMPMWLKILTPEAKLCQALSGAEYTIETPGCTYTTTLTNCKYNADTGECKCDETTTESGPSC